MFPLRINGPKTKVGKLRMKPNLGGLDWKTTRQTCNTVGKERGEEVLEFLSARTVTLYHENAWPPALLNPPSPRIWEARGQTQFCKTQLSAWVSFSSRALAVTDSQCPGAFWDYELKYKSPSKHVARSVQHFLSLLTVQMEIQYHCEHKVRDSENITKHWKAIAAAMGR